MKNIFRKSTHPQTNTSIVRNSQRSRERKRARIASKWLNQLEKFNWHLALSFCSKPRNCIENFQLMNLANHAPSNFHFPNNFRRNLANFFIDSCTRETRNEKTLFIQNRPVLGCMRVWLIQTLSHKIHFFALFEHTNKLSWYFPRTIHIWKFSSNESDVSSKRWWKIREIK